MERSQSREGGGEPGSTGKECKERQGEGSGAVLPGTLLALPPPPAPAVIFRVSYTRLSQGTTTLISTENYLSSEYSR